jgi:quinol monooxygenase YgiN
MNPKEQATIFALSIIGLAGTIITWLLLLPKYWIQHDIESCALFGLTAECIQSVPRTVPVRITHIALASTLIFLGYKTVSSINATQFSDYFLISNRMRTVLGYYAAVTGLFSILRAFFHLGKPLLVGAAAHNLGELLALAQLLNITPEYVENWSRKATIWICLVIATIIGAPSMTIAIVVEQASGIVVDYLSLAVLIALFVSQKPDSTMKNAYGKALFAMFVHIFFTILPLVLANFSVGETGLFYYLNETIVVISSIATHWILWGFAEDFDQLVNQQRPPSNAVGQLGGDFPFNLEPTSALLLAPPVVDPGQSASSSPPPNQNNEPASPVVATIGQSILNLLSRRPIVLLFVGCLMAGLASVVILPQSLTPIRSTIYSPHGHQFVETSVIGTSVAKVHYGLGEAFLDHIESTQLITSARRAPGNLQYDLHRNIQNPDEFRFVEVWITKQALEDWLKNGKPKEIFGDDKITRSLLFNQTLFDLEAYQRLYPASQSISRDATYIPIVPPQIIPSKGGIHFEVVSSCDKVWSIISNISDCTWVLGCKSAIVDEIDPDVRYMTMMDDSKITMRFLKLNSSQYSLNYNLKENSYFGNILLRKLNNSGDDNNNNNGYNCEVSYQFSTPGGKLAVDKVYRDFWENRVPFLQKLFGH